MMPDQWDVSYDQASDVLYASKRPGAPARSLEDKAGVIWRYDTEKGDLIGITIVDFSLQVEKNAPSPPM